jgi:hypothetical protein
MRILASLLLLSACASAQIKLSPQDERDIRAAIEERAKIDNQRGTGQVWSERGPVVYKVRHLEPLAPDVATADADSVRIGGINGERRQYTFILTRTNGRWTIARKISACRDGWPPATLQPISGAPQCEERGSSGCPD